MSMLIMKLIELALSQLRDTAMMYGLPHPMSLLNAPMRPEKFRSLVKDKVAEYWHKNIN